MIAKVSLILGIIGALGVVELRPQVSVSSGEMIDSNLPLSAPFRVTNNGYLALRITHINCYLDLFVADAGSEFDPDDVNLGRLGATLDRGDSESFLCQWEIPPSHADLVIVVDYTNWGMKGRRYFRFEGVSFGKPYDYLDHHGMRWQWVAEPTSERLIKEAGAAADYFNKEVDDGMWRIGQPIGGRIPRQK